MDFAPLGQLGNAFWQGLDRGNKSRQENERQTLVNEAMAKNGGAMPGLSDLAAIAYRTGQSGEGLQALGLAEQQKARAFQQGMAREQMDFQRQESQRAQANADRSFGASRQDRADDIRFRDVSQAFQRTQADRQQENTDRAYKLQERTANQKPIPEGFQPQPDGTMRPIPGGPADPDYQRRMADAKGKPAPPLAQPAINALGEAGSNYSNTSRFLGTFKDSYGGWRNDTIGNVANVMARKGGIGNEEAATWWQDYDRHKNVVRNQLFGSALTRPEAEAFERADITPGMTPQAIRRNLQIQQAAATSAAKKLAGVYNAQGKSQEEIEAAIGFPMSELGIAPKKPGQATPSAQAVPQAAPQAAPQQSQPDRWSDGQFEYRRLPDGRVQRRAIQQ